MTSPSPTRTAGILILAATGLSLFLMLHHPTSLDGTNDGHLLADWSNTAVHGAMIACLLTLALGFSYLPDLLSRDSVSVRAGRMALAGGMIAFIGAGLVSGFAVATLIATETRPDILSIQIDALQAINHALANLGMVLVASAMAAWAVRMVRLDPMFKIAGSLGLVIAMLALGWLVVGRGAFGLYPALIAVVVFAVWSSIIAIRLIRSDAAA